MNEIATLIRYAGREVTQSILDVAKEQLVNNELLDEKEFLVDDLTGKVAKKETSK